MARYKDRKLSARYRSSPIMVAECQVSCHWWTDGYSPLIGQEPDSAPSSVTPSPSPSPRTLPAPESGTEEMFHFFPEVETSVRQPWIHFLMSPAYFFHFNQTNIFPEQIYF